MKTLRRLTAVIGGALALAVVASGAALGGEVAAESPVYVGAGTKITTQSATGAPILSGCNVAAAGRDSFGNKVALTAGHCGELGQKMAVNGQAVGTYAAVVNQNTIPVNRLDYAFVKLDDTVVIRDDPASPVDVKKISAPSTKVWPVCKYGHGILNTGERCGATTNVVNTELHTTIFTTPFDSGGPVYVNRTELVGLVSRLQLTPFIPTVATRADAAVADATAKNTVGAGFVPEA